MTAVGSDEGPISQYTSPVPVNSIVPPGAADAGDATSAGETHEPSSLDEWQELAQTTTSTGATAPVTTRRLFLGTRDL